MKTGKTLVELAQEIERRKEAKADYVADTRNLELAPTEDGVRLVLHNGADKSFAVSPLAHRQIGDRLGIPAKYYDRMLRDNPGLLAGNVNTWLRDEPEQRLVRTLDGTARAFLSNVYLRIDNNHMAETALPVLFKDPQIEVKSCEVTDSRLYIKAVTHAVRATVNSRRVGDVVEAGVIITNSEVGLGAVQVMPFFHYLVCMNGMVRNKEGLRVAHVGTRYDADDFTAGLLQDDTRAALDRGILLKVRDMVAAAMDAERFMAAVRAMEEQTTQLITGDPAKAIELLADEFVLTDPERGSVLRHLIAGGDISRYGVMNAVTRTAEDSESYDRATEIEAMGGRILDLQARDWSRIATAA